MEQLNDGAKIGNLPEKTMLWISRTQGQTPKFSVIAFGILFILLIDGLEHLFTALDGRFGKLLPTAQFSDESDIAVLALVALQRPVDRLVVLYIDYYHIVLN